MRRYRHPACEETCSHSAAAIAHDLPISLMCVAVETLLPYEQCSLEFTTS